MVSSYECLRQKLSWSSQISRDSLRIIGKINSTLYYNLKKLFFRIQLKFFAFRVAWSEDSPALAKQVQEVINQVENPFEQQAASDDSLVEIIQASSQKKRKKSKKSKVLKPSNIV